MLSNMVKIWQSYCRSKNYIQGGPKNLATMKNHHEIVLESVIQARIFINFDYRMNTRI